MSHPCIECGEPCQCLAGDIVEHDCVGCGVDHYYDDDDDYDDDEDWGDDE